MLTDLVHKLIIICYTSIYLMYNDSLHSAGFLSPPPRRIFYFVWVTRTNGNLAILHSRPGGVGYTETGLKDNGTRLKGVSKRKQSGRLSDSDVIFPYIIALFSPIYMLKMLRIVAITSNIARLRC